MLVTEFEKNEYFKICLALLYLGKKAHAAFNKMQYAIV